MDLFVDEMNANTVSVKLITEINTILDDNDQTIPYSHMWYSSQSLVDRKEDENVRSFTGEGSAGWYRGVRRTGVEGDPIPVAGVPGMNVGANAQTVLSFSQPSVTLFRFIAQESLILSCEDIKMKDGEKSVEEFAGYRDAEWSKKYPFVPQRVFPSNIMFGFDPDDNASDYTLSKNGNGDGDVKDWMNGNELHLTGSLKGQKRQLARESTNVRQYLLVYQLVICLCFSSYEYRILEILNSSQPPPHL